MDHVTEFVGVGVSLLLLALLVFCAVTAADSVSRLPSLVANQVSQTTGDIAENRYLKYCGDNVSGSDVVSAVRKFRGDSVVIEVTIYTDATSQKTVSTLAELGGSFQNLPSSPNYINPAASFSGVAVRNSNDVIEKIVFTQSKYVSVADGSVLGEGLPAPASLEDGPADGDGVSGFSVDGGDSGLDSPDIGGKGSAQTDLDIVFSDEEGQVEGETQSPDMDTESSQYVTNIKNSIDGYSSRLDDLAAVIASFDVRDGERGDLTDIKAGLVSLKGDVASLKEQVETTKLLKSDVREGILSGFNSLLFEIDRSYESVQLLATTLASYEDSSTSWLVGYPVAKEVKAGLEDGVLVFTGKGRVDVGNGLPPWSAKKDEIREVKFSDGVVPENIDYWFSGCKNLRTVNCIPESVESANGAFQDCNSLQGTLKVEGTALTGVSAFRTCKGKAESLCVTVPEGSSTQKAFNGYLGRAGGAANVTVKGESD